MEQITFNKIQIILSVIGGTILTSLGGYDVWLNLLVSCIVLDVVTGILYAIKSNTLSSEKCRSGLLKKMLIFCVIYMANMIDVTTGSETFRNVAVIFYISNEGISIFENLGHLGVSYPKKMKDIFEQLKNDEDEKEDDDEDKPKGK